MLKTVLNSVAKYASSGLGGIKDESEQAAKQLIMQKAAEDEEYIKQAVLAKEHDPCVWGYLSEDQELSIKKSVSDDDVMESLAAGAEFEVLRNSGALVHDLSSSLSSTQTLPERPPHIDSSPADGICLIRRSEAEDIDGGATVHKRCEQAAWAFVQDNVKFKELDKLSGKIDDSKEYDGLRKHFDPHHKYHHVLVDLTDHALIDRGLWDGAVQEAKFPTEVRIAEAAPKVQASLFAPKALHRTAKAMGGRQSPTGAKGRISWAASGAGSSAGSSPLGSTGARLTGQR